MSKDAGTWTAHTAAGLREDLSDVIYDISPTETPFVSNLARVRSSAVKHEWQMDNLASATNIAHIEGEDHSGNTQTATQRLGNYNQIFRKDIVVTGTIRAVDGAGRSDELDYLTAKAGRELKRDMEKAFLGPTATTAGSFVSARALAGAEAWIGDAALNGLSYAYFITSTNTTGSSDGAISTSGLVDTAPVDGTVDGIVKDDLDLIIRKAWENGGDPRVVMVGGFNKGQVSKFTGIATLQKDVPGNTQGVIVGAADIYVSDFGVHTIVPNRFTRDRTAMLLDMNLWANAELRPMSTVPIARTGDSDKVMLITETTLECRNPFGSGKLPDLSSS